MLISKTKLVNYFCVLMLCTSFVVATDAEASKWSAIAEILERLFKSSDEMAEKQRAAAQGGIHGAQPSLAEDEQAQDTDQSDRKLEAAGTFRDCVIAAEINRNETMSTHITDIVDAISKGDSAKLKRLDDSISEIYCRERVACDLLLSKDQSYLQTDFDACMLNEQHDVNALQ